jgi:hypothetical protein
MMSKNAVHILEVPIGTAIHAEPSITWRAPPILLVVDLIVIL